MAEKLTLDELLDQFKGMTLVELQAFVARFEETFGVSAALVIPSDAMRGRVEIEPEPEEEPTAFDVILASAGQHRVQVIKQLRASLPGLGLKEAKDLADKAPVRVLSGIEDQVQAEMIANLLRGTGATVEVRPAEVQP